MKHLPSFLLHMLDSLGQHDVAGDIAEELRAGRSRVWGLWQVSAAMVGGVSQQVRGHKWAMLRAVLLAWGLFFVLTRAMFMVGLPRVADLIARFVPLPTTAYMARVYEQVDGVMILQPERLSMSWQQGLIAPMLGFATYFIAAVLVGAVISLRYSGMRFTAVCVVCAAVTLTMLPAIWPRLPPNLIAIANLGYQLRFLFPLTTLIGVPLGGTLGRLVSRGSPSTSLPF